MTLEEAKKILYANGYELYMHGSSVTGKVGLDIVNLKLIEAYTLCVNAGFIPTKPYKDTPNNPALHEAAKEFNDSLLDAQKKKIDELLKVIEARNNDIEKLSEERNKLQYKCDALEMTSNLNSKKIARMGKAISHLNNVIHNKNVEIDEKRKGCIKVFNENQELRVELANKCVAEVNMQALHSAESALIYKEKEFKKALKDKDAVLSDVAEELRLSKIREENLTEVCQKYLKEIEGLKEKETLLVGIINKNDKVIGNLNHELCKVYKKYASLHKEYGELESKLSKTKKAKEPFSFEKAKREAKETFDKRNKEFADFMMHANGKGNGILDQMEKFIPTESNPEQIKIKDAEKNEETEALRDGLAKKAKLVKDIRNGSKEYVDYGIEAEKVTRKMAKVIVCNENMSPEDFSEYYELANGKRFIPHISTPEEKESHPIEDDPEKAWEEACANRIRCFQKSPSLRKRYQKFAELILGSKKK